MAKAPQKERLLFYCLAAALPLFLVASLLNYSLIRGEGHYLEKKHSQDMVLARGKDGMLQGGIPGDGSGVQPTGNQASL